MTYSMLHWQGFMWPQGPYIKQILFRRHIKLSTYSKDKNYSYIQVSWHFVFKEKKKLYGLDWENLYYILYWHYHYTRVTNDISAVCHVCQFSSQVKTYVLFGYLYGLFFLYFIYTIQWHNISPTCYFSQCYDTYWPTILSKYTCPHFFLKSNFFLKDLLIWLRTSFLCFKIIYIKIWPH